MDAIETVVQFYRLCEKRAADKLILRYGEKVFKQCSFNGIQIDDILDEVLNNSYTITCLYEDRERHSVDIELTELEYGLSESSWMVHLENIKLQNKLAVDRREQEQEAIEKAIRLRKYEQLKKEFDPK